MPAYFCPVPGCGYQATGQHFRREPAETELLWHLAYRHAEDGLSCIGRRTDKRCFCGLRFRKAKDVGRHWKEEGGLQAHFLAERLGLGLTW